MELTLISEAAELEAMLGGWGRLSAPSPMQSPEWLATWWECYRAPSRRLFVVAARVDEQLVGLALWYVEMRRGRRAVRWLGDGRVCSDHATLLAAAGYGEAFADRVADWLLGEAADRWDELQLEAINADDAVANRFVDQLSAAGCPLVVSNEPVSCFVDLPATRHDYEMRLSKNHRKRCRKWTKQFFDTGRAKVHVATDAGACLRDWRTLVDLHNERRVGLGGEGAFEDEQFFHYHRQVMPRLAAAGRVQLRRLELNGEVVAVEYVLQDGDTWYAYQSGLSQSGEEQSAGNLSLLALVDDAISAGCRRLDLLRGDEAYKFSWGAQTRPARSLTIRRPGAVGRVLTLVDTAWQTARVWKRGKAAAALGV